MRILWLLVARAGSKGVPNKNGRVVGPKTLIEWKAWGAMAAMHDQDRIIISTDSPEYAEIARRCGVAVPFLRPAELAQDDTPTAPVVWDAMVHIGETWDAIMLLEPSSPFTKPQQYRDAIAMIEEKNADAVIGMRATSVASEFVRAQRGDGSIAPLAKDIAAIQRSRRQDFVREWTPCGGLYLFRWDMFEKTRSIYGSENTYGLLMDMWSGLEVDTMDDLALAEFAVERGYV